MAYLDKHSTFGPVMVSVVSSIPSGGSIGRSKGEGTPGTCALPGPNSFIFMQFSGKI